MPVCILCVEQNIAKDFAVINFTCAAEFMKDDLKFSTCEESQLHLYKVKWMEHG